jgi:hypothetical protein
MCRNKTVIVLTFICLFTNGLWLQAKEKEEKKISDFGRQMIRNFSVGWDGFKTEEYRWGNFNVGTSYGKKFHPDEKIYWLIGLQYNWGKYTLYPNGTFGSNREQILTTNSISVPLLIDFDVYENSFLNIRAYTGPVYEVVFSSNFNKQYVPEIKKSQWAWTVGAKVRFFAVVGLRVAYSYYPTGLFKNGDLNRSAITFSLGL